eukprot:scaffold126_cov266-Prasinococcus_capsulatus_cf.AAC.4
MGGDTRRHAAPAPRLQPSDRRYRRITGKVLVTSLKPSLAPGRCCVAWSGRANKRQLTQARVSLMTAVPSSQ